jgi:hypothetical protein
LANEQRHVPSVEGVQLKIDIGSDRASTTLVDSLREVDLISQLVDPEFIKSRVTDLAELLAARSAMLANGLGVREAAAVGVTTRQFDEAARLVADLAVRADYSRGPTQAAWLPRDPRLSMIQSILEESYRAAGAVEEDERRGLSDIPDPVTNISLKEDWIPSRDRSFMRQAEESDLFGWSISFAVARAIAGLHGRPSFPSASRAVRFGNKARLVLVGDWARYHARPKLRLALESSYRVPMPPRSTAMSSI